MSNSMPPFSPTHPFTGCPNNTQISFECDRYTHICLERTQLCDGAVDCPTNDRDEYIGLCFDSGESVRPLDFGLQLLKVENSNVFCISPYGRMAVFSSTGSTISP